MQFQSHEDHVLDLLRQTERAAATFPLVVWFVRIAIRSLTGEDDARLDATEAMEQRYAKTRNTATNIIPLYRKSSGSSVGERSK